MYQNLGLIAVFVFAYSAVAGRLGRTPINGAVVYLAFGTIAGPMGLGLLDLTIGTEGILTLAELTLALVLFTDACNADLAILRRVSRVPWRMLVIGLPLTILLGFAAASLLFPELGLLEAAILATILAPTDAALGKAVVRNPALPPPVRESLNVESGLNDGICVPVLFTFLALASRSGGGESAGSLAMRFAAEEIGIGLAIGVGFAAAAAGALTSAARRGWLEETWAGIPVVALAFACFTVTQVAGGSGFIACFAGGLVFGVLGKEQKRAALEGAEGMGDVLSLATWVAFGAVVVGQLPGSFDWRSAAYAVLSLTVVRMVPVFISLLGLGASTNTKLFLGWFGPRGLASIVFGVMVANENLPGRDILIAVTGSTVVLSILAHGLSANPLATAFGARAKSQSEGA
jgi:NhaP-type Na+/H+ or K+/H+ antiporter